MIEIYNNSILIVKLLVVVKAFEEILGCRLGDNTKSTNIDLFRKRIAALARGILI